MERIHEIERRKYMGITFEMIEKAIQECEEQREKELAEIIMKYDFLVGSEELKGKLIEVLPKEAKIIYTPYIDDPTAVYAIKKFEVSSLFSEPYKPESEESKADTFNKIIAEVEKVNPSLIGPICSIEAHEGAREMQSRILRIINRCKESED